MEEILKNKDIFIIQFPQNRKLSESEGKIIEKINKYIFSH